MADLHPADAAPAKRKTARALVRKVDACIVFVVPFGLCFLAVPIVSLRA